MTVTGPVLNETVLSHIRVSTDKKHLCLELVIVGVNLRAYPFEPLARSSSDPFLEEATG